jgi:transposase
LELYPINPRSAARYREAFRPSTAKDDPTDAECLLDLVRKHREQLRRFIPDDSQTRTLRLFVEDRRGLVNQRTRHVLRLQARLKTYYPQALDWAGGLETVQACDFLDRWPTLAALQESRPSDIRKFYRRRAHRAERVDTMISEIQSAVALTTDPAVITAATMFIRSEVAQLRSLAKSIHEYETEIEALFAASDDATIFNSFPGAGAQLAPRLAVAFGTDRERYHAAVEIAQSTGVAPVMKRSGKSAVVQMRWASPKFSRQTFHEFARVSINYSEWARSFYRNQRDRGFGQHAAIRALAYRWIRVMFACWRDRRRYDESFYLQQLQRRGSPHARAA